MLSHMQSIVSDGGLRVAPRFSDLILQMRMGRVKINGMLDKSSSSMDLIDALQLSCWNVKTKL